MIKEIKIMPEFNCKTLIEIEITIKARSKKEALAKLEDVGFVVSPESYETEIIDYTVSSDNNDIDWEISKIEPIG
jgi:hypothetical protein